jgi:hypothetical protein
MWSPLSSLTSRRFSRALACEIQESGARAEAFLWLVRMEKTER